MTSEELQIVRAVLRESARLSNRDADALTVEIARRVQLASRPDPAAASLRAVLSSAPEPCECHGDPWCEDDK